MISEVAACCKELRLSHNIVDMAEKIEAKLILNFLHIPVKKDTHSGFIRTVK